jgi:hypothetical protein
LKGAISENDHGEEDEESGGRDIEKPFQYHCAQAKALIEVSRKKRALAFYERLSP